MAEPQHEAELREILGEITQGPRTIAFVGIKDDPQADAYRIPRYMQEHGYRIVPVNPMLHSVLGEPPFASVTDVDRPLDVVDLFRAPEHVPGHTDEILTLDPLPGAVWMQLGIQHGASAARLRAAGIRVVQDRCIMVEHGRLLGPRAESR